MAFADYNKILLFGDSITEQSFEQARGFGFGAEFTNVYRRKLDVVARGFSGYNTSHALHILPKVIPPPTETIFFGANDAVLSPQLQHIPLSSYTSNLRALCTHPLILSHSPSLILITPPPICEYITQESDAAKGKNYIQRLAAQTKQYRDAAIAVGKELNVPVVDLWGAFVEYAEPGYQWREGGDKEIPGCKERERNPKMGELLRDGLHFNPKGYKIMYDEVIKCIKTHYPELDPEQLEFDQKFPYWEVAPKHDEEETTGQSGI
ncbi:Similar to GDSL esterase/lipase At5g45920; acc. no. Q6NMR9 [Pyronema omphalodes CBS 100304]|uniref:Similar to GDSL esterase/lipase At5g45920 acc. no. Q6NMR9 n=1 Tax=Pyronema omphalodes (strain CBS 100304) TaxID=1076935 RepID=U4KZI8_PYROM|nr:Similar to GDSL esterase/lipase At5g45920; acc. no. Q6NMR9 [Pyronema omphalodes CBS 100304]